MEEPAGGGAVFFCLLAVAGDGDDLVQGALRLGQVFLRLMGGANDPASAAAAVLLGHPVLVVVAAPDVHKPLVLLGRLQVEPTSRVRDAGVAVAAELDHATAVVLVVHGPQVTLIVML